MVKRRLGKFRRSIRREIHRRRFPFLSWCDKIFQRKRIGPCFENRAIYKIRNRRIQAKSTTDGGIKKKRYERQTLGTNQ